MTFWFVLSLTQQGVRKYYSSVITVGTKEEKCLKVAGPASCWLDRCVSDVSGSFSKTPCISWVPLVEGTQKVHGEVTQRKG